MKTRRKRVARRTVLTAAAIAAGALALASTASAAPGRWLAGDIHNHTYLTDGKNTQVEVLNHAIEEYGLDYFANSEHGGQYGNNPMGIPFVTPVWRWLSLSNYSYPIIQDARALYPERLIIQGLEWNAPTHEHVSVGIVGPENEPGGISAFEYRFDERDTDLSRASEGTKEVSHTEIDPVTGLPVKVIDVPARPFTKVNKTAGDTVAAVQWLDENYSTDAYAVINHPSRMQLWHVGDFRVMNDVAPDVAFGMEGLPGHQADQARGGYGNTFASPDLTAKSRTYGGADYMTAQVGGLWDSLLGEGRHFWIFNNSDYHTYQTQFKDAAGNYYDTQYFDFWPGQYAKTWAYTPSKQFTTRGIVNAMRSGNEWVVNGDLISALKFQVKSGKAARTMGQTLSPKTGRTVTVTIAMKATEMNNNGDQVKLDHVDVIAGDITGRLNYSADPASPYNAQDTNPTTHVVKTFGKLRVVNGWMKASFKVKATKDMYLRLRGTNVPVNTPNETDAQGNPLNDELAYVDIPNPDPTKVATKPTLHVNTPETSWNDLWFYSNPVFVDVK